VVKGQAFKAFRSSVAFVGSRSWPPQFLWKSDPETGFQTVKTKDGFETW